MPVAEIAAGITSARAAYDLTKAMLKSRDAKILADGTRDLQLLIGEIIGKFLEAQQAQMAQLKQIEALEAEIKHLRGSEAEKQRYELKDAQATRPRLGTRALALPKLPREWQEIAIPVFGTLRQHRIGLPMPRLQWPSDYRQ